MLKNKIENIKRYWHNNIKSWILRKTKFESIKCWWSKKCKPWILKNRTYSLVLAGIFGTGLAYGMHKLFPYEHNISNPVLHSSLTILALGLPTFFVLWLFRTEDVQRQIDKTEENTNNSTFFECVKMLTNPQLSEEEITPAQFRSKRIALEQLAYLRRETGFNKRRIDLLTSKFNLVNKDLSHADLRGLDLSKAKLSNSSLDDADLSDTNLSGANLSDANLRRTDFSFTDFSFADLSFTDLTDADLTDADLRGVNLIGTDLSNADLRGANLSNFTDNDETKWEGAIYSPTTNFNGTRFEDMSLCEKEGMCPN